MLIRRQKYIFVSVISCLMCALLVFASERSYSTLFGANFQDVCTGNECILNDAAPATNNIPIHVTVTFANAEHKRDLQLKFANTVSSLFQHSTRPVTLYIIGDGASQLLAKNILEDSVKEPDKYKLVSLSVDEMAKKMEFIIRPMQERFSAKPGAYYNHALFFLSVAMHHVMPESVDRLIMLDADLKFLGDIAELYKHFDAFTTENIIGIAHEAQPVYRHTFWKYRGEHHGTRVGQPPPDGLPGFNSGVLLLDLNRMRHSSVYNSLLNATAIGRLADELHFKGHLGDQDFYTLIGMFHEQLFYVLPCQWNRQLCRWWLNGYKEVFDLYHRCDGDILIYHGNCNTPIP